jgi:hypothetical protein
MDTIQDYIDDRDTVAKHRSFIHTNLRTLDARYNSNGSTVYEFSDDDSSLGFHQQTNSIDHPWQHYRRHARGLPRNMGGPFITTKLAVGLPSRKTWKLRRNFVSGAPAYLVEGDLFPHIIPYGLAKLVRQDKLRTSSVWTEPDAMSSLELRLLGEKIMLSLVPTSAAFDAVTALGEPISDGALFGLPGRSLLLNGDPGGEYLNTVFGIQPTARDIEDFNTALGSYDKVIKQYLKDANKLVRRKTKPYSIPEEVTQSVSNTNPITAKGRTVTSTLLSGSGSCTIEKRINRKIWYAGAFRYHIPKSLSNFEKNLFEWQRAYKIIPDPADIWNLLPFTWLADWFTNGGDSLRHLFLQATEGATQWYGYVMCESVVKTTYTWTGLLYLSGTPTPCSITSVVVKTIKQRERVSPFGSAFTGVDLTPRQLAILAALGVAK